MQRQMMWGKLLPILGSACLALALMATVFTIGCAKPAPTPVPAPKPVPAPTPTPTPTKIVWKFAHSYSVDSAAGKTYAAFVAAVNERSKGALEIQAFPSEQLVKAAEGLDAVQTRRVEMQNVIGVQTGVVTETAFSLPGLFSSAESQRAALLGDAGQFIRQEYAKHNALVLDYWTGGQQQLFTAKKLVKTPADLKGMKIRIGSELEGVLAGICGASPVSTSSAELYLALQTGTVDGAMTSSDNYVGRKLYEVAKYYTDIGVGAGPNSIAVNKDAFAALPPNLQQIVQATATEVIGGAYIPTEKAALENNRKAALGVGGTAYTPSPEELAAWKVAFDATIEKWLAGHPDMGPFVEAARKYSK